MSPVLTLAGRSLTIAAHLHRPPRPSPAYDPGPPGRSCGNGHRQELGTIVAGISCEIRSRGPACRQACAKVVIAPGCGTPSRYTKELSAMIKSFRSSCAPPGRPAESRRVWRRAVRSRRVTAGWRWRTESRWSSARMRVRFGGGLVHPSCRRGGRRIGRGAERCGGESTAWGADSIGGQPVHGSARGRNRSCRRLERSSGRARYQHRRRRTRL